MNIEAHSWKSLKTVTRERERWILFCSGYIASQERGECDKSVPIHRERRDAVRHCLILMRTGTYAGVLRTVSVVKKMETAKAKSIEDV